MRVCVRACARACWVTGEEKKKEEERRKKKKKSYLRVGHFTGINAS